MLKRFRKIFELEASTGILLLISTIIALLIANSQNFHIYEQFLAIKLPLSLPININKELTIHNWINDGLMAIFFLLIGLELKEEIINGELSSKEKITLPAISAIGGVIFPAIIFYLCNLQKPQNLSGFAIPTATDIAFAYGVICMFGNKIPKSLKVFLISLAIFDDLIAIIIIAIFYSQNLKMIYFLYVGCLISILLLLNFINSRNMLYYLLTGILIWLAILFSGVHATIAGIILAIFIPHKNNMLHKLIKTIAPTVNFLVLPIFAFANSGVRINDFSFSIFQDPLIMGIVLGLFLGKQIGVMLFSFLAVRYKIATLPKLDEKPNQISKNVSWLEFYGVAILAGIGFTMSFFIGSLAFKDNHSAFDTAKIGVLSASLISAIFGILVIFIANKIKKHHTN